MKPEFHYPIWSALTERHTIDQYDMAPVHTLEQRQGGKISYGDRAEFITGQITSLKASTTLAHTFNFAGSDAPETQVTYEIKPIGDSLAAS